MKKLFLFVAVALLAVACSKEDDDVAPVGKEPVETNTPGNPTGDDTTNIPQNKVNLVERTFVTSASASKTAVYGFESQVDLGFHADDSIQVFDASGNYVIRPTGVNMQEGGKVNGEMIYKKMNFKGEVPEGDGKLGFIYPFKPNYTFSGTTVTNVNIPTTQVIPAGTYDPTAIFFYAYTNDVQIVMQNPCALVMITVDENVEREYSKLSITRTASNGSSAIAGTFSLDVTQGELVDNAISTSVELIPSTGDFFMPGKTYFAVVKPGKGLFAIKGLYTGVDVFKTLNYETFEEKEYTFRAGKCYHVHLNGVTADLVSGN